MPEKYRNSVVFGSIHGCSIKQNILKPNGSTFTASRGDDFLVSGDKNFRPINLRWGHNGEIYCIDWHDQNPCHQTNPDDWDYERGRVYRIQPKGLKTKKADDMGALTPEQLAILAVTDDRPWWNRTALRLLHDRTARATPAERQSVREAIEKAADVTGRDVNALRRLWATHGVPTKSEDPAVRAWGFRNLAGLHGIGWSHQFAVLAERQTEPTVRRELASAAARHPEEDLELLIRELAKFKEDAKDPIIPQLLWQALEPRVGLDYAKYLSWLRDSAAGNPLL